MTDKARLEAQLADLKARLERIEQDLAEPLNADSSEQAVEMEDDASLEAQGLLLSRQIASVDRALERIVAGTYGECVRCGGRSVQPGWKRDRKRHCASIARVRSNDGLNALCH